MWYCRNNVAIQITGKEKAFIIRSITYKNNSKENIYIQGISLNGKEYTKSYIHYKDLMAGGNMMIEMGPAPSKTWGVSKDSRPYSGMDERE